MPHTNAGETDSRVDNCCRLCQLAEPPFVRAVAFGSYDEKLRDLVHLLKFDQVRPAAKVLGGLLAASIAKLAPSLPSGSIAVVPVPLHFRKQAQRGFNQAELIARCGLKQLSRSEQSAPFELMPHALIRARETGSQIGLTRHQRRENLRGAFKVGDPTQVRDRNILLVDDVYTTGATASECARVLLRAGAARVWVATVCRTIKLYNWPGVQPDVSGNQSEQVLSQSEGREANGHLNVAMQA
ncbi:MAG TPA: ComF family protein [Terriglobales bacterium]|nr:ComF family protein [Terriglobales bacterium]